jgi:hypothetical protein
LWDQQTPQLLAWILAIPVLHLASNIAIKMAFSAPDVQALMIHIAWLCIDVSYWINPRFRAVFPSFRHLSALVPEIGITLCEGLLDVVQGATAPSIDWFLSLPTVIPSKTWGIYVLVLQKGKRFKLYIGSGTSTVNNGVRYRVLQHKGRRVEPSLVKKAEAQGFKQVHCSLLAWCPTPAPAHVPVFRTAIVALEAAFHLIFWPMYKRTTQYSFPDGQWARSAFTWDGLCHHNPLTEGVIDGVDNLDFTPEQLEHMAAVAAERRRVVRLAYERNLRANKTLKYSATRLAASRRSQPKVAAKQKLALQAKKFHCSPCNISCRSQSDLNRHCRTDRHKGVIADGCGLYCEPCDYTANDRYILRRHRSSATHIRLCTEAANTHAAE